MIREAISSDYELIIEYYKEFDNNSVNLFNSDPFSKLYVYLLKDKIVGFINYSIIYDRCELNYIYVEKEYRNKKIGSKLMEFLIDNCIKSHCVNITLEVSEKNNEGLKLYDKYKFVKSAIRKNYYKDSDGILMIRELINHEK